MTRLTGILSDVGRLFGILRFADGGAMIDITYPPSFYRGETRTIRLTVTDDADARVDLTTAAIEMQIRTAAGAAGDPALQASIGDGITLLTQSGETLGQADIVLTPTLVAGPYVLDVTVTIGAVRSLVIQPLELVVREVVTPPV